MNSIKNIGKAIFEKAKVYDYHREHKIVALKRLKIIESYKGNLDPILKKKCDEYANETFGDNKYAPWLYNYAAYAREFREGWIPDNYYGETVMPNMNGDYGKLCNRNVIINQLIGNSDLLDICYYVNKLFLSTNYERIREDNLKQYLFEHTDKVVYKVENSRKGKGIYFFNKANFDIRQIKELGIGVFQQFIEQHPFYSEFNNSAVSTLRITTVCNNACTIEARGVYLRFGRKDETHVMSASQMRIPVNLKSGKLYDEAFYPNFKSTKTLPENDMQFNGMVLPSYDKCLKTVIDFHNRIPFIRCIGWDIILDKNDDVKIIELNGGHNGIIFNETIEGPIFKGLGWENLRNK